MNKYSDGKIYGLYDDNDTIIYVGSTCALLSHRYRQHVNRHNNKYRYKYEIDDWSKITIKLIEAYPCESKTELEKKEGEYQRKHTPWQQISGRTKQEYDKEHREQGNERARKYRENNREKVQESNRKSHAKNREHNNARMKEYAKEHKEADKEKIIVNLFYCIII